MAIALRGLGTTGSATNGGNITLSFLTLGLQQNDVVIVGYAMNAAGTGGTSSAGWTQIGANVTNTVRIQIFRKVMGATPDTSIVLLGTAAAADSSTAIAYAYSGVSTGAPEGGVALTSATGTSTNPDCPSITPPITGAICIAFAAGAAIDTTGTGGPTGYSNFGQISSNDNNDTTSYIAWKGSLTAGVAEDPSAFTGVSSVAWAAYSIILVPPGTVDATTGGSYAITGTDATTTHGYPIVAAAGSYALTGTDATTAHGYPIAAGAGSYTQTGTDASTVHKWLLDATTAGSYAVTGTDTGTLHQWIGDATIAGSYSLTGTDASLVYAPNSNTYTLTADPGAYDLTGTDASALHGWVQAADAGSYALTGTDAATLHGWLIAQAAGSYDLTGTDATLTHAIPGAYSIVAGLGSYALSGTDATQVRTWVQAADAGSYTLTGVDAALLHTWRASTGAGAYDQTGTDATLTYVPLAQYSIAAGSGSYLLTGTAVTLTLFDPAAVAIRHVHGRLTSTPHIHTLKVR